MKIRTDHVTNSSSSSFILGFKKKDPYYIDAADLMKYAPFSTQTEYVFDDVRYNSVEDDYKHIDRIISRGIMLELWLNHLRKARPISDKEDYAYNVQARNRLVMPKQELIDDVVAIYEYDNIINSPTYTSKNDWLPRGLNTYNNIKETAKYLKEAYGLVVKVSKQKRTNGDEGHEYFNLEAIHQIDSLWFDLPEQTGGPSRRALVLSWLESWWDKHVGPDGLCIKLEFGDSHGMEGYLEEQIEQIQDFRNSPDIIVISNH